jgi:hypothetical protein
MDPLAQLKDIHLPEPVHNYPLAIGWWLLAFTLIIIVIVSVYKWRKRQQLHKAQQSALGQLKDHCDSNAAIFSLLKWSALQYFPRANIASLHGIQLQQFLIKQLPEKIQEKFKNLSTKQFTQQYQKNEDGAVDEEFKQAAKMWLSQALPPKDFPVKKVNRQQGAMP